MHFDLEYIPEAVLYIRCLLKPEKTYVVGGILRDSVLHGLNHGEEAIQHLPESDWDLATPHPPREVMRRLRAAHITVVPTGIEHGTVTAVIDQKHYEITTFRHDIKYEDGRHPEVNFTHSLEEDLKRRDFTINAFALDLDNGEIIDLFSGQEDLEQGLIRTVGDPHTRFQEDYLRMLRACRFAAKLEGEIEEETADAIRKNAFRISFISAERIRDELIKMLTYPKPSHGFLRMHTNGLLLYILPELEAGFDVWQNRFHSSDVAMHTLYAVDAVNPKYPLTRWATVLHDLGKVPAKRYLERKGDYVFYSHQYISKRMAKRIMRRLRFSNKEINMVSPMIENHMYNLKPDLSESATRRFLRKLGRENVDSFLRMRMADRKGNKLNPEGYEQGIFHFVRNVRNIDKAEDALTVRDLKVSGHDLMDMGLKPGPIFSSILNQLLEEVIEDPSRNERDWLLQRIREFVDEYKETGTIQLPERHEACDEEDPQTRTNSSS